MSNTQGPRSFRNGLRLRASLLAISTFALSACAPARSGSANNLTDKAGDNIGCTSFSESFYGEVFRFPLEKKALPSREDFEASLHESFNSERLAKLDQADRTRLAEMTSELYDILSVDVTELASRAGEPLMQTLSAIELGDRTTNEKRVVQDKIESKLGEIERLTKELMLAGTLANCTPAATPPPSNEPSPLETTLFAQWKANRHPAVYGGLKALATSYQSCSAATVAAVSSATPDVAGISIVGTHKDGVGSKREITNLSSFLKSHVYLKNYSKPSGAGCFDIKAKPLIYDYGGKPYATASDSSSFDLFKDEGTGTAVLGIDCSAFVYVALASAGLKLKSSGTLLARGAQGISSYMLGDPVGSKLNCLVHAGFATNSSIKPGDVISKPGHVFLVETVGADPFGIAGIKSADKCTLSNISISKFDFTILQSSNSKNGIGIHRTKASDFLKETSMGDGLRAHAVNACKAKFGQTTSSKVSGLSIVRHSGTSACRANAIKMERESCVASCEATTAVANLPTEI